MNCHECRALISDHINRELEQNKREKFEIHISECHSCSEELKKTAAVVEALRKIGSQSSPCDCWITVHQRIAISHRPRIWFPMYLRYIAAPVAALAVCLLVLFANAPKQQTPTWVPVSKPANVMDYVNIHASSGSQQRFSDSDVYITAAEMQNLGDR